MHIRLTNEHRESLGVTYSHTNIHIENSCNIDAKHIQEWIRLIRDYGIQAGYIYGRSDSSWINEWKTHNLLYKWGIARHRTRDVDLDEAETLVRRIWYFLLSLLYW